MNKPPSTVIEGFQGRMSIWMSGIFFIIGGVILFQLRALVHGAANTIDFENMASWFSIGLLLWIVVMPVLHQGLHALAALAFGAGIKVFFGRLYPRVRPVKPLDVSKARLFLLAPQALTLLCVIGILIKPIAIVSAFIGAVNIAASSSDVWKALGLKRVDPAARIQFQRDYCELVGDEG